MSDVADSVSQLAAWLPRARALITQPDADGQAGGGQPGSAPPWNPAAAAAYFDAHAAIRAIERQFRTAVTGSPGDPRGWSHANLARALDAIERLSHAMPQDHLREDGKPCRCDYCRAVRDLDHATTAIQQLPAIDEQERPQRVPSPCPYCGLAMLRAWPRSRRVACVRLGACEDGDGNQPAGRMAYSRLDGSPVIEWADGLVT
jgi:hypothetical protein